MAEVIHLHQYRLWEPLIITNLSLPRRRESSDIKGFWIPVFTGMTFLEVPLCHNENHTCPRQVLKAQFDRV